MASGCGINNIEVVRSITIDESLGLDVQIPIDSSPFVINAMVYSGKENPKGLIWIPGDVSKLGLE